MSGVEEARPVDRFGRLSRIPAASAIGWTHEAHDFTPWLAENLELLGSELGLALELREREHAVGRYSLDLLLEDAAGRVVIVENQFGQTDHDHLGKLLTYCAGTDAEVVIWIAETLTAEHLAALEWLNGKSADGVDFFGIELELWQIGDSPAAPRLNVVVRPNEWRREVSGGVTRPTEWNWRAYVDQLSVPEERIRVGRALLEQLEEKIAGRGLPWQPHFRQGYVAIKRSGDYNVMLVDVYWNRPAALRIKLPQEPSELGLANPFPDLDDSWDPSEREWIWHIPSVEAIPDLDVAINMTLPYQPETGPMRG